MLAGRYPGIDVKPYMIAIFGEDDMKMKEKE